jgi:hypothetical protein
MMPVAETLILLVLLMASWFAWASLRAREAAIAATRAACRAEELLFLDDTVAIESVWPVRDERGQLKLRRVYSFEFSDTGNNRRKGTVTLIGDAVLTINIGLRSEANEQAQRENG